MKTMMMITIAVLMTMTMAKSDETIDTKVKTILLKNGQIPKSFKRLHGKKVKNKMLRIGQ